LSLTNGPAYFLPPVIDEEISLMKFPPETVTNRNALSSDKNEPEGTTKQNETKIFGAKKKKKKNPGEDSKNF
jgi:hypothetical protein